MLGSDLIRYLGAKFRVTPIHKENYFTHVGSTFDIVINANGNSKRFWANSHPVEDFIASTESVYKSIVDFTYGLYVYISSSDVYEDHTSPRHTKENTSIVPDRLAPYGLHKYFSELLIRKYVKNYLILRSSMILGKNLKKGPFYDNLHKKSLYITRDSRLQLITTVEIANIIQFLLDKYLDRQVYNVGGVGTFSFHDIHTYINTPVSFSKDSEKQLYEMNITKLRKIYPIKTSQEYLRQFVRDIA